jgi:uncharacterized protein (UPF0276 family)
MKRKAPRVGLSLIPEEGFRAAASPLFEEGLVDVLEWSVDLGFDGVPEWVDALCDVYANAGRLCGHGVTYSALSAHREPRKDLWLAKVSAELKRRRYVHFSEHMGFMSTRGFRPGAPLPVPMTEGSIRVGREALGRLADVVGSPIGLENLAPVFGPRDVQDQGEFLDALLAPMDGFLLMDVHNLYCQSRCVGVPLRSLIEALPLHRVREIHVSGGSEWRPPGNPRRAIWTDSHDGPVPREVFDIIPFALERCPNAETVIFERFQDTLETEDDVTSFQQDYRTLRSVVAAATARTKSPAKREKAKVSHAGS